MLLFGSKMAKQAVRIVHVPSRTVFKNWPFQGGIYPFSTKQRPAFFASSLHPFLTSFNIIFSSISGANLGYVHSAAFSPASGYVALGNAHGEAPLFRLKHYGSF
jgi:U3 small nucleolar RNA-associated protein 18